MRAKGNIIANYGADGQSASFSYPGSDLTNPANYAMDDFYYRAFHNGSELEEGVLNAPLQADRRVDSASGRGLPPLLERWRQLLL